MISALVAERHSSVAPAKELLPPAVQPAELAGNVGIQMTLEPRHLKAMIGTVQDMVVRRGETEAIDVDSLYETVMKSGIEK